MAAGRCRPCPLLVSAGHGSHNANMAAGAAGELAEQIRVVLAARREVLEGYLFGSRARGDAGTRSDTDVAVYFDGSLITDLFGAATSLAADLMAALGDSRVDLIVLNTAPPLLYHRVLRDGIRLVARDLQATTTREGRAMSRYCDFLPFQRRIDAVHAARIARGEFGQ